MDKNFLKYLSTAPVLITAWLTLTASIVIEANRFYPDMLYFPL
jgi:photosystem I subunit IX